MENVKRLYRSATEKVIGGVCGGLADYLRVDVVILRIAFVLLFLFGGSGILVYIIMWIVIPIQKEPLHDYEDLSEKKSPDATVSEKGNGNGTNGSIIAGMILIFLGLLFLVDRLMPYTHILDLWPLILVAVGVLLIKPELLRSSGNIDS